MKRLIRSFFLAKPLLRISLLTNLLDWGAPDHALNASRNSLVPTRSSGDTVLDPAPVAADQRPGDVRA